MLKKVNVVLPVLRLSDFLGMFWNFMKDGSVHGSFLLIVFYRIIFFLKCSNCFFKNSGTRQGRIYNPVENLRGSFFAKVVSV